MSPGVPNPGASAISLGQVLLMNLAHANEMLPQRTLHSLEQHLAPVCSARSSGCSDGQGAHREDGRAISVGGRTAAGRGATESRLSRGVLTAEAHAWGPIGTRGWTQDGDADGWERAGAPSWWSESGPESDCEPFPCSLLHRWYGEVHWSGAYA